MAETCFLGVDQGSSHTKAVLVRSDGEVLWSEQIHVSTSHRSPIEVEQDSEELLCSIEELLRKADSFLPKDSLSCRSIGLALQRSGVCAWELSSRKPLSPLQSWRDLRTQERIRTVDANRLFELASIPLSAHYAGGKISLLQEEFPSKEVQVTTLDSYLLFHLTDTQRVCTEDTMAHRTMLYDLHRGTWSSELCKAFKVSKERLPQIVPSHSPFGLCHLVQGGTPLVSSLGDQQAALAYLRLLGHETIVNLGSISSVMTSTNDTPQRIQGYITSIAYSDSHASQYVIEGTSNASGRVLDFLTNSLFSTPEQLNKALDSLSPGEELPLCFCPFGNISTPHWRDDIDNMAELTQDTTKAHLSAALIENVANFLLEDLSTFSSHSLLEVSKPLLVTGGISQSDYLLQYLADCTNREVMRADFPHAGALGAALSHVSNQTTLAHPTVTSFLPKNPKRQRRYQAWCSMRDDLFSGKTSTYRPLDEVVQSLS